MSRKPVAPHRRLKASKPKAETVLPTYASDPDNPKPPSWEEVYGEPYSIAALPDAEEERAEQLAELEAALSEIEADAAEYLARWYVMPPSSERARPEFVAWADSLAARISLGLSHCQQGATVPHWSPPVKRRLPAPSKIQAAAHAALRMRAAILLREELRVGNIAWVALALAQGMLEYARMPAVEWSIQGEGSRSGGDKPPRPGRPPRGRPARPGATNDDLDRKADRLLPALRTGR